MEFQFPDTFRSGDTDAQVGVQDFNEHSVEELLPPNPSCASLVFVRTGVVCTTHKYFGTHCNSTFYSRYVNDGVYNHCGPGVYIHCGPVR